MEHIDLVGVISLSMILGSLKTYGRYHRDWCGIKLIPSLITLNSLPAICVIIVYAKVLPILSFAALAQYHVPIYLAAALIAEFITGRLLRPQLPKLKEGFGHNLPATPVVRRITKKKLTVADKLFKSASSHELLCDAIETSDLSRVERSVLKRKLTNPPTKSQVFEVINEVGLAHIKVLV